MNINSPVTLIMTKEVVSLHPNQKLIEAKHIFEKKMFHHHIPVIDNDKLVGIISLVDYMRAIKGASIDDADAVYQNTTVFEMMSTHPVTRPSTTTIKQIAEELGRGEVHAIVISDSGTMSGIVSTADIINCLLSLAK